MVATMQSIADAAGVSRATVSYVLNGRHIGSRMKINHVTVSKVEKIAELQGYCRNEIARAVKTGKTNAIGIVGGLSGSYCLEIIKGISDAGAAQGYFIKLFPAELSTDIEQIARQCAGQRLAGVICSSLSEEQLHLLRERLEGKHIPIVLVDNCFHHDWCPRAISDDFNGAKSAVKYLSSLGHRKIIHITNDLNFGFSRLRYDGYCAGMDEYGLKRDAGSLCVIDSNLELTESIRAQIREIFLRLKPTAVTCGSDPIAMKVIIVASELNIKIPDDLSIIGYAGLDYSVISNPPLTTVIQPFYEVGRQAFYLFEKNINGSKTVADVKLPTELIIRNSTAPVKKFL